MVPASPSTTITVRGPRLPLELIVLILESLPFEQVFSLGVGDVLQETLVAKLNHGDPLEGRLLQSLNEHPQILSRLAKMSIYYAEEDDELPLLAEILEQCPNLKSLALMLTTMQCSAMFETYPRMLHRLTRLRLPNVTEEKDFNMASAICKQCPNLESIALRLRTSGIAKLKNHLPAIWRFAQIEVVLFHEGGVPLLEEICSDYPNLPLKMETAQPWANVQNSHQILRRLNKLYISDAGINDLPVLDSICNQYPIVLNLSTNVCLQELLKYPALLRQLARLGLDPEVKEKDVIWLDNRETFPKLRKLEVWNTSAFQTLTNCSNVHAKLRNLGANFVSEDDAVVFDKMRKLCQNLSDYRIKMPFRLFRCLSDFPKWKFVLLSEDRAVVHCAYYNKNLQMKCDFRHLGHLQLDSLHLLSVLELKFTGEMQECSALNLLQRICENSPNLKNLEILWYSSHEPSTEFIQLVKEISQNSEIRSLSCSRLNTHVYI